MMPHDHERPPAGAGKAGKVVVVVIGLMIVAIFVGFNLDHADTLQENQSGVVAPQDAPKSPDDLQRLPASEP